jgi:hypothetical protein
MEPCSIIHIWHFDKDTLAANRVRYKVSNGNRGSFADLGERVDAAFLKMVIQSLHTVWI